jgi:putative ABC transport system ATP-binding protein
MMTEATTSQSGLSVLEEPVARVEGVTKVYGSGAIEVTALNDVTVQFERGRMTAIMGPSGSGKSTLLHCLAGLDTVTSGRILVGDADISAMSDKELTVLRRDRIGFVFQSFNLVPTLTAERNITLQRRLGRHGVDRDWFDKVVNVLEIRDRLDHRPSELSGGQQQRVAVARALISKPEMIIADEPTGNLDQASGREVLSFLRRAVNEYGQTVVIVTHDAAAASYADRVIFLADGQVVGELHNPTTAQIFERLQELEK